MSTMRSSDAIETAEVMIAELGTILSETQISKMTKEVNAINRVADEIRRSYMIGKVDIVREAIESIKNSADIVIGSTAIEGLGRATKSLLRPFTNEDLIYALQDRGYETYSLKIKPEEKEDDSNE